MIDANKCRQLRFLKQKRKYRSESENHKCRNENKFKKSTPINTV